MNLSEKTKRYAKLAGVALIVLFAMNRCAVACNRGRALDKTSACTVETVDSLQRLATSERAKTDSVIRELRTENLLLKQDTAYLRKELKNASEANKALIERDRTVNVHIKQQSK